MICHLLFSSSSLHDLIFLSLPRSSIIWASLMILCLMLLVLVHYLMFQKSRIMLIPFSVRMKSPFYSSLVLFTILSSVDSQVVGVDNPH